MNTEKVATCGTLESNDAMITIMTHEGPEVVVSVESIVQKQFGEQIEAVVRETMTRCGLSGIRVMVQDKGAYDCTIRARAQVAAERFKGESQC